MFACVLQAQDFETNEDLAALRAIQYSESETPEYLAEKAKKRGNQAFARGPQYYKHALRYYSVCFFCLFWLYKWTYCPSHAQDADMHCRAIHDPTEENKQLHSQLFSNRAAVHLVSDLLPWH